jgi:hypothetical protein
MNTAALQGWRGALVRDEESGIVGILMDVVVDYVDPQVPRDASPRQAAAVFIRPQGGGLEYIAAPDAVRLVNVPAGPAPAPAASPGCPHPVTVVREGRTHCAACGVQLYL